jgi:hypothetical protein
MSNHIDKAEKYIKDKVSISGVLDLFMSCETDEDRMNSISDMISIAFEEGFKRGMTEAKNSAISEVYIKSKPLVVVEEKRIELSTTPDTSQLRKLNGDEPIPYRSRGVAFILITASEIKYANAIKDKNMMIYQADRGILLAAWPGQWSQDIFVFTSKAIEIAETVLIK